MYMIDEYQLVKADDSVYLGNYGIGAKISNEHLAKILSKLQTQDKSEISEEKLKTLAEGHQVSVDALKSVLVDKLKILQPRSARKFKRIVINSDDSMIQSFLTESLEKEYEIIETDNPHFDYQPESLVLFYRNNYSHEDFKLLHHNLPENVYFITAGILHKILIIDNLYFKGSGLPTHFSNLNNLMACVHNDISITKNNWLLFYRQIMKNDVDVFPEPEVTQCQRGYAAYALQKFMAQFTNFWKLPTTLDEVNWFWNVDLTSFSIQREVAIHSPYSEYDMNLDLTKQSA